MKKIANDAIYYNIGNFIYLGAQWIISIALVRMGGFKDAGYFSLAMSVCNMFSMIANYGLRAYQVSDVECKYSNNSYVTSRIITVFASIILCFLYSLFFQKNISIIVLIFFYMLYKCIEAYSDVLTSIFQNNGKMPYAGISLGAKGILNLILFIFVYSLTNNLIISVAMMAVGSLIVLVCFDYVKVKSFYKHSDIIKKFDANQTFSLLKSGFLLMIYSFTTTAFNSIPKLIIEHKDSAENLGIFSSIAIPTVVITTFAAGMLLPVAPKFAEYYNKKESKNIYRFLIVCSLIIVAIGIISAVFSALVGKPIFKFIFGETILTHFSLLYYMIISSVLIAINNCLSVYLTSIRKIKQELAFAILSCIIVTVMSFVLIEERGIYGVAIAIILALVVQLVLETVYVFSTIKKLL